MKSYDLFSGKLITDEATLTLSAIVAFQNDVVLLENGETFRLTEGLANALREPDCVALLFRRDKDCESKSSGRKRSHLVRCHTITSFLTPLSHNSCKPPPPAKP